MNQEESARVIIARYLKSQEKRIEVIEMTMAAIRAFLDMPDYEDSYTDLLEDSLDGYGLLLNLAVTYTTLESVLRILGREKA